MFKKEKNVVLNTSILILTFIVIFYVLNVLSNLLIPLIIAILFSFAIIGVSNFYKRYVKWGFISFTLSLLTYSVIFWLIGKLIGSNIEDLIQLLPVYQTKIGSLFTQFFDFLNIEAPTSVNQIIENIDLQYVFSSVVGGVTSVFSKTGLILFYVLFILLEYRHFKEKLNLMFMYNVRSKEIFDIIDKIKIDIKSYFFIKTIVSFITASVSFIIMETIGLDLAIFWSFLIFILNFIPSIGSIIAVSFPVLLSLIQFDSYYPFVLLLAGLAGIQVLMGNIIEPKFMGNKLNLSPLVIIISLGFWGTIWGVVGMLLSVPIMVMINIILAKIPATRSLAILLSEKGELQVDGGEEAVKKRKKILKDIKNKFSKK